MEVQKKCGGTEARLNDHKARSAALFTPVDFVAAIEIFLRADIDICAKNTSCSGIYKTVISSRNENE